MGEVAGGIKMKELPELDIAELLDSEEVMAGYLSDIMASGDSTLIMSALGDIARAKGMSAIARETGLNRESLYKTFKTGTEPKFDTVLKIMSALNLSLKAAPAVCDR